MLGNAIVHLKWSPDVFWSATPHETFAGFMALDTKKWNAGAEGFDNMTRTLAEKYEREEDEQRIGRKSDGTSSV